MRLSSLLLVLGFLIFAISAAGPVSAQATGLTSCDAPKGGSCTSTFDVESGNTYSFSLRANSSGLSFWVADPSGAEIQSTYLINMKTDNLTVGPDPYGSYVLHFLNNGQHTIHVDIVWTHNVKSGAGVIVNSIPEFPAQPLIGVLTALVIAAAYLIFRRTTKGQRAGPL